MPPFNNKEVKIIKIPLMDNERPSDYPKNFPKMPIMYLELLENKGKIKQDLINKDYVPVPVDNNYFQENKNEKEDFKYDDRDRRDRDDDRDRRDRDDDRDRRDRDRRDRDRRDRDDDRDRRDRDDDRDRRDRDDDRDRRDRDDDRDRRDRDDDRDRRDRDRRQDFSKSLDNDKYIEDNEIEERYSSRTKSSILSKSSSSSDNELSNRLKELLNNDLRSRDKYSKKHKNPIDTVSSRYTPYKLDNTQQPINTNNQNIPPTLAELEAKGQYQPSYELRDVNVISSREYNDDDKKRELIFKFDLLKKSYPVAAGTIPEYTIHSNLQEMQKSYDMTVRKLSLDSSVESYKTYLIGGFMLVEFVFGNFLGFEMEGFTQQQIVSMHSYEKLLIEIGEKSYVPTGSKWPVELRLLSVIIMNAGFFIVGKMILKKTGANLLNMVNSMNTNNNSFGTTNSNTQKQKRKMKGPDINLQDIPDLTDK